MNDSCDVAIIGGGAAGLAAAIFAAEASAGASICLLDGAPRLGAKILVSGGGRCNVTHDVVTAADFNASPHVVRNILAAFDAATTVRWMESLGVPLKREETGKLFPVTDSARTVVDALIDRCRRLGVQILTERRASDLQPAGAAGGFSIVHSQGALAARRVIVATGGRSLPRSGSDGAGWKLVRALGHTVTETFPALVPLVLEAGMFHAEISGLSHDAELSTFVDGRLADRRRGSLLWTHFGLSGPVVMDASRFWVMARGMGRLAELKCSFVPGRGFEEVERQLSAGAAARPRVSVAKFVAEELPDRLALALLRFARVDPALPLGQMAREPRRALVHALTALPIPVERDRGWNYAEVTAGGVPLAEIDFRTMQSRKAPGLYLAGEILDCDGRIGGFNFQWAWSTGFLAGRAAGRR